MIRFCLLTLTALTIVSAQEVSIPFAYKPSPQLIPAGRGGRGGAMPLPRTEAGKPFSATVTSQTTQTLADGTHLHQTTTTVQYRDSAGRVRTENETGVTIRDPVAGTMYRLYPATKTALNLSPATAPVPAAAVGGMRGGRGNIASGVTTAPIDSSRELAVIQTTRDAQIADLQSALVKTNPNETSEDLGTSIVNGVSARGTRTTTIVPVGAIGNDRELRSVTERWFSSDLNLLIKSISMDPRFGTTTYELTNIKQANPDSSLFQVPNDYTMVSNGRR